MRVAFVVQRCGLEVNGGAEAHCLQIAQRMAKHWQTDVLTTCAQDYMTWENWYAHGEEQIGDTCVRRFPVDQPRNVPEFNRLSKELHASLSNAPLEQQENWMRAQGPMSTPLLEFLSTHERDYDALIFFGYLYATTYFGLPRVREKAYLAPLAHDEWPIYCSMWETLFSLPRRFLFNTSAEEDFLRRRFPLLAIPGDVIGVGIEAPAGGDAESFRKRFKLDQPFLLYLGRVDESKGCKTLFDYFIRAREEGQIDYKLVLAGTEVMRVPFHDDIVSLGFIEPQEKWDALAACEWLVMPSPHESLSMVVLEAWAMRRPALVNAGCEVLRRQCEQANAGLWYATYEEWLSALRCITQAEKTRLGINGAAHVSERYSWDRVENDYLKAVT